MAKVVRKDINLFDTYQQAISGKEKGGGSGAGAKMDAVAEKVFSGKNIVMLAVAGGALLGILLVAFIGLKSYNAILKHQIKETQEAMQDEEMLDKIEKAKETEKQIGVLRAAGTAYKTIRSDEIIQKTAYKVNFTPDLIEKLVLVEDGEDAGKPVKVGTITGLSFEENTLTVKAASVESRYIPTFVRGLADMGIYSDVTYASYELDRMTTEGVDPQYVYEADCEFIPVTYALDENGKIVDAATIEKPAAEEAPAEETTEETEE